MPSNLSKIEVINIGPKIETFYPVARIKSFVRTAFFFGLT